MTKQVQELVKSMEGNEKLIYDLDAEKDLLRLQRKARCVCVCVSVHFCLFMCVCL